MIVKESTIITDVSSGELGDMEKMGEERNVALRRQVFLVNKGKADAAESG